jgi:hypothetical protein
MKLEIKPIELDHDDDTEGRLILHEGRLAAVLSQLSDQHAGRSGRWFVECGFGPLARCGMEFESLDDAQSWIAERLTENDRGGTNPG